MTDWIVIGVICLLIYLALCVAVAKLLKRRFRPDDAFEAEMADIAEWGSKHLPKGFGVRAR
jgi:hypothetical protein